MRMLVLGGGAQGTAVAFDLLRTSEVESVVLVDHRMQELPEFLRSHQEGKLQVQVADASDEGVMAELMKGMDAVLCALPYYFNLPMSRLALDARAHYADLGGNTQIVEEQRALDPLARERGLSMIPDCGLAPGMVNILAQAGMEGLEEVDSVRMWVGGLPQEPKPPLNYQVVYSLEGVLDYYTTPGIILQEGEVREVEALSGLETVVFPEPLGELEAFYTAGGASTLPTRYEGRVRTLEYRTLRYPGHAQIMSALRALGLLDTEPVDVDGVKVSPRNLFIRRAGPLLTDPHGRDVVALRVEVRGKGAEGPEGIRYDLMDFSDPDTGITAMMRCTGYSLAITGLMQVRGEVEPGVRTPDEAVPAERYLEALAERGIRVEVSREPTPVGGGGSDR